ncbi:SDR family NAD(P)-dependent oxidoreductase [Sneathiella chinensis]|uniref:Capsular polysaccharide biosynthesis dehydrogenase/reductase n=1 Tax=Sneathiella chinensis TaxID=349750 RepID=A0ABQ5U203_9PROT|nr:SDR family NAD(P)-dependent oxidoreductase [Sneathiella chinensis]GLQ05773.1 capsular polysaccharide biosynthesis dehydrogenase/reductase [Sneathiella chinensis]
MTESVVAITGASSGIGKALALQYAKPGAVLALVARNTAKLETIAEACRKKGATVETVAVDVRDYGAVEQWLRAVNDRTPLDIVFANAGVTNGVAEGEATEKIEDIQTLLDINLTGAIHTVSAASDIFRKNGGGRIAVISSLASYVGFKGSPAYCASKAGLRIYCQSMQRALRPFGIDLTIVYPGYVKTPMSDRIVTAKPFTKTAEQAAALIVRAVEQRRTQIGFPWLLWTGVRILAMLPLWGQNIFVPAFDYQVAEDADKNAATPLPD